MILLDRFFFFNLQKEEDNAGGEWAIKSSKGKHSLWDC